MSEEVEAALHLGGWIDTCLTDAEMKDQATRCDCGGCDDYCPCQNVPDRATRSERRSR